MVPDAALTHEYWYINEPVTMVASRYKVGNILEACDRRITKYIIDPKYRAVILEKLSSMGIGDSSFESLDICAIVNEWLIEHYPDECERIQILEAIESVMQVPCRDEGVDDEVWESIYDEPRIEYTVWDVGFRDLYNESDLRLEELEGHCV